MLNVGAPERTGSSSFRRSVRLQGADAGHRSQRDSCLGRGGGPGTRCAPAMILADVNVLIYAFRTDTAQHSISKSWLNVSWRRAVRRVAAGVERGGADHDQSSDLQTSQQAQRSLVLSRQPSAPAARRNLAAWRAALEDLSRPCIATENTGTQDHRRLVRRLGHRAWLYLDHLYCYARFVGLDFAGTGRLNWVSASSRGGQLRCSGGCSSRHSRSATHMWG